MICHALIHILATFQPAEEVEPVTYRTAKLLIAKGASEDEPQHRPGCELRPDERFYMYLGKDASIHDMLTGGNGFPGDYTGTIQRDTMFDLGCTQEKRDMRSLKMWSASLEQCKLDKANGRVG